MAIRATITNAVNAAGNAVYETPGKIYEKLPSPVKTVLKPISSVYGPRDRKITENKLVYVAKEAFVFLAKCFLTAAAITAGVILFKASVTATAVVAIGLVGFAGTRYLSNNFLNGNGKVGGDPYPFVPNDVPNDVPGGAADEGR